MKPLSATILMLVVACTAAFAQRSSVSKNIIVDDLIMTIKVDVEEAGRSLHYHRSFNVEGMNREERQALEDRILDSLGVNSSKKRKLFREEPVAVAQGGTISSRNKTYSPTPDSQATGVYTSGQYGSGSVNSTTSSASSPAKTVTLIGGEKPFTKEVNDDPETGRLFMRYRYTKDGEEVIYERTINTQGKTDKDKQRIIRETEKELGLPSNQ